MHRRKPALLPLIAALMFALVADLPARVIHVRQGSVGNGSGSDWPNAISTLSAALAVANAGDDLWVATGQLLAPAPTAVNPETPPFPGGPVSPLANTTAAFVFPPGIRLFGGFSGTESSVTQRDITGNPTTLLAACLNGSRAAFVYKSEASLLDGFTIDGQLLSAGGMFGAVTRNCVFWNCRAAPRSDFGFADQPGSALTTTGRVERCTFTANVSTTGAAVWASNAVLLHCQIIGNRNLGDTLFGVRGGGLYGQASRLENCLIANNRIEMTQVTASSRGGGVAGYSCELVNCTVANNLILHPVIAAAIGGGAYLDGGLVQNSVFWGNNSNDGQQLVVASGAPVSYSLVPGGFPGPGNLALDPLFANAPVGNFRLTSGSPAVDAGLVSGFVPLTDRDLDDKPRMIDGDSDGLAALDLGAFEFGDYAEFLGIVIGPNRKARLDLGASLAFGWRLEASTNLVEWTNLGTPSPNGGQYIYRDESAPGIKQRFYRIVSP